MRLEEYLVSGGEKKLFHDCECQIFSSSSLLFSFSVTEEKGRVFDIASLTKLYTAYAVLSIMKEQGIPLSASLSSVMDVPGKIGNATLSSLLTHSSSLPAWYPFYSRNGDFCEVLTYVLDSVPMAEGVCYSDIGFMLLRVFAEQASGLDFPSVIEKYVRLPLGIDYLCFNPAERGNIVVSSFDNAIEERMCRERNIEFASFRAHDTAIRGEVNDGNAYYFFNGVSGHAGLFTDADGLRALALGYLRLKKDPYFSGCFTPQCDTRCLAFHTGGPFPTGIGHTGFTGTSLFIDEDADIAAVLLTNRLYYDRDGKNNFNMFRKGFHELVLSRAY